MHLGSQDYIAEVDHAQHYLILLIGFFFSLFAFYSYFSGCFGLCYFFVAHRGTGRVIFSLWISWSNRSRYYIIVVVRAFLIMTDNVILSGTWGPAHIGVRMIQISIRKLCRVE